MTAHRRRAPRRRPPGRQWASVSAVLAVLALSLACVAAWPGWSPLVGLLDGLLVGIALGVSGLIPQYDDCWDEFWEATALSYLLGAFALLVYLWRRERPSAFYVVGAAAGTVGYLMLLFISPLQWLMTEPMLYAGTLVGWLVSGFFRPFTP